MILEVLPVDVSTAVSLIASVLVVMIGYLVYKVGIGEKSFEEAIEEQKRRSIEEEQKLKSEKVKKEKKFKKTWTKKNKEKSESEPPTVKVTYVKDVSSEVTEAKGMKTDEPKSKSVSPVLTQTAEVPAKIKSTKQVQEIEKTVQDAEVNTDIIKKTASEVKKSNQENKKSSQNVKNLQNEKNLQESVSDSKKPEKLMAEKTTEIPPKVKEMISTNNVQATTPPNATNKKKKKEMTEKEIPMTTNKLLSFMREIDLEPTEIQSLIDVLLNKQKDPSSWTKKSSDQVSANKKALEREHTSEQDKHTQSLISKLKDENSILKSKITTTEKVCQDKVNKLQSDIHALNAKIKQLQEFEKEKNAKIDKENEHKLEVALKEAREEKVKLSQRIAKLESDTRSGASKTDFETLKKSREELQKVHTLVVQQHTQLVSTHKTDLKNLNAQIAEAKAQLEEVKSQNKILSNEVQTLKDSKVSLEASKKIADEKLKAEKKCCANLEDQIKQLTLKITDCTQLQSELEDLRQENERLAEQLVSSKERIAGDGQEVVHQNGEVNGKAQEDTAEKEKLLKEKEDLLDQVREDLNKQKARIAVLSEEIENQKQKNNELREKNWKAIEALKTAEDNAEQRIKEMKDASDAKIAELEKSSKVLSSAESVSLQLKEQLKKAENEANQRLSDYNKEVEKNKQLSDSMVSISRQRDSAKLEVAQLQQSVEELKADQLKSQTEIKEILQRICPSVSIDSCLSYEKWLVEFEQQATSIFENAASSNMFSEVQVNELLQAKEKEYLQNQSHYDKLLSETESTLSALQQRVEAQDTLWQQRLQSKEEELKQVRSERDTLSSEKEAMQSTMQQLSQLEELQEKLKVLQNTFENAESERLHFEQKFEEVHKNCINLRDQLENKEKQILELQKESSSLDHLRKEIENLKVSLEEEKQTNKNFSSQMVKLNSLVRIGQDALTAEQEMVKKLKSQLESAQVSTANGTSTPLKTPPKTNIEDALAKK